MDAITIGIYRRWNQTELIQLCGMVIARIYAKYRWRISVKLTRIRRKIMALREWIVYVIIRHLAPLLAESYYGRRPPPLKTYGRYHVVGQKYHTGIVQDGDRVELRREPNNPWDSNGIRCYNGNGEGIGYIARKQATYLARIIDMGARVYGVASGKVDQYRQIIVVLEGLEG